jgi:GNAT superfamily N-acetyltransferase
VLITPLNVSLIPSVEEFLATGAPYIRVRTSSDYWMYAELFSTTCPIAIAQGEVLGAAIAFRSQDLPADIYIQDVMSHPGHRREGITRALIEVIQNRAIVWGCTRLYLTSEPDNRAAHATWLALGFANIPGDCVVDDVSVISNYKGPGKHRAVYEMVLRS